MTKEEIEAKLEEFCYKRNKYISKSDIELIDDEDLEYVLEEENGKFYNPDISTYELKPSNCVYCKKKVYQQQVLTYNLRNKYATCNLCKEYKKTR